MMIKTKLINAYFTFNIQRDILNLKNKRFSKRRYADDKLKNFISRLYHERNSEQQPHVQGCFVRKDIG